jgi:aryl-alcohol dehydrogenase-like predicted oxidoreductase
MKFGIGTAQVKADYGFLKKKLNRVDLNTISNKFDQNIDLLDTAPSYGNAEKLIGSLKNKKIKIITKLSKLEQTSPGKCIQEIKKNLLASFRKLNKKKIYAILLHDEKDIIKLKHPDIKKFLLELKKKKIIKKIGYACYNIEKIPLYQKIFKFDIVQFPINIFTLNQKKINFLSGFKNSNKIDFHARSIFLQGIALKAIPDLNGQFKKLKLKLKLIESECKKKKISRYNYLISCIYSLKFIDYCIIGLSSIEEFLKLKKFKPKKIDLSKIQSFYVNDKKITDPRLWKL